jgi:prepilin-type N-terminal cleavage/methylation domain-containing protein
MNLAGNIKKQGGFTLIEMVISVGLFAFMITSAAGIFQAVVIGQRSAIAAENIQEAFRYALETMSKEVRNAQKDGGVCNASPINVPDGNVYSQNTSADLIFKNKNNQCVQYYLSGGRIYITRASETLPITPGGIDITSLKFIVKDDGVVQPSVTFLIFGYVRGKDINKEELKVQTSISSRYYE